MAPDTTAAQIRRAQFRIVLRGLDRTEVEEFLASVAARMETLEAEVAQLKSAAIDVPGSDLESELDAVGREVTAILQAAREAADAMRERASIDSARWRGEALAEAEANRRDAAADAEALRRDAWTTGTEMLEQAAAASTRMTEQAERDVLTVMGEAEREAHRLTSSSRREAEDLLRNATMASEKMTAEATRRRDDIIDAANRQAAAAQERTRALEQRRDELMEELENVRSTLTRLEGSLDERRESLDYTASESTSVRVVPNRQQEPEPEPEAWALGETVRLVQPEPRYPSRDTAPAAQPEPQEEPVADSPTNLIEEASVEVEPAEAQPSEVDASAQEEPTEAAEPEQAPHAEPEPVGDDEVDHLFASLRGSTPQPDPGPPVVALEEPPLFEGHDWLEERDTRLLPITNRALRGTKKSITELQNIALDHLRTDEDWRPVPETLADTLGADLIALWAESFAAGHAVAEQMTGSKLKRPATPQPTAVAEFSTALSHAVAMALDGAGGGQRERQSAASRVFRVWRSDEAEQRIRELAIRAYQLGVERSSAASN
jgi:DivIVA domain-containing protein